MTDASYHAPVLVEEVVRLLEPERGGLYFDGTVGGGGHAEAILERGPEARLVGVDRDGEALSMARDRLARFGARVRLVRGDYADAALRLEEPLAGVLLDLGVSSHQLDEAERGFSFRRGVPLDMRMSSDQPVTAADVLNESTEAELARVFREWGEERRARRLAAIVVRRRARSPFRTSDDLVAALHAALGDRLHARDKARIFQALRIAVNDEMGALERGMPALRDRLESGGVFLVITYQSLDDRQVKSSFRAWSEACVCPPGLPVCVCGGKAQGELIHRKAIVAGEAEVAANPRARSAKLRAWRKAA
ncbi:MAG: 16S rRNA (cytosine(1402)-N(4))-methyltransferase RsmH [Gemmatimonadetes bacterium]|nr:16S rRNA (cytosine(1402)-N(4))-methyltransferase RsmH [Gemmatimonadota bacterium]